VSERSIELTDDEVQTVVGAITITTEITREMVDDILTTAFESGIYYWCGDIEIATQSEPAAAHASEVVARGGTILIAHDDGKAEFTIETFLNGLERYCKVEGRTPSAVYEDHDATAADEIVQLAIFDDIVYG
jgi:hypothetical protein